MVLMHMMGGLEPVIFVLIFVQYCTRALVAPRKLASRPVSRLQQPSCQFGGGCSDIFSVVFSSLRLISM
jgi:hypothetical protein